MAVSIQITTLPIAISPNLMLAKIICYNNYNSFPSPPLIYMIYMYMYIPQEMTIVIIILWPARIPSSEVDFVSFLECLFFTSSETPWSWRNLQIALMIKLNR